MKKQKINNLPVFDSDEDFLKAFKENKTGNAGENFENDNQRPVNPENEDFKTLLEESFKKKRSDPVKKSSPMPLKKRLKRYPPVEIQLDLHGFNTIGAQVKAKSFIVSCKQQGYFTVRIVVGKGLHSELGPVLPDVIEDLLKQMKAQDQVIFYEWDKKKKSQSGAVIVYLKQFEQFD